MCVLGECDWSKGRKKEYGRKSGRRDRLDSGRTMQALVLPRRWAFILSNTGEPTGVFDRGVM